MRRGEENTVRVKEMEDFAGVDYHLLFIFTFF